MVGCTDGWMVGMVGCTDGWMVGMVGCTDVGVWPAANLLYIAAAPSSWGYKASYFFQCTHSENT